MVVKKRKKKASIPPRVKRYRRLVTGKTVEDTDRRVLEIHTNSPQKWRFVDLETGQVWRAAVEGERVGYAFDCQIESWPPWETKTPLPISCTHRRLFVVSESDELLATFINGNRKDLLNGLREMSPAASLTILARMMCKASKEVREDIKRFLLEVA